MKHAHDGLGGMAQTPATHSGRWELTCRPPAGESEVRDACMAFLTALTTSLAAAGCTAVGHIKGVLRVPEEGMLAFGLTTLDAAPRWRGAFAEPAEKITLTLNVIVFGVDDVTVEALVDAAARAQLGRYRPRPSRARGV